MNEPGVESKCPFAFLGSRTTTACRETTALLRRYWWMYAAGCAGIVVFSAVGIRHAVTAGNWAALTLAAFPAGLLGIAVVRRALELRAFRHFPGPRPSFFLGSLDALLAHGHGGRDRSIRELHAGHGPAVRMHLAWGSRPYLSFSSASRTLNGKLLDSFRRADRTLLPVSLMGMEMGDPHSRHRNHLMPFFTPGAVESRLPIIQDVTASYVNTWKAGGTVHDDLQADIHRWSAHCLGSVLFGAAWDRGADLTRYLEAIAVIEEEISFRTFHPFFVRWAFARRALRARAAYRYLFDFLTRVRERHEGCGQDDQNRDLLSTLVALERAGTWTRAECIEEMMSLILGGTDAMSYLVSQALVLLSNALDVQDWARRALEDDSGAEAQQIVQAILHETMRLFPPVPFSSKFSKRQAVTENGLVVPPQTSLMWMKTVVGTNPDLFHDPERFAPERFCGRTHGGRRESVRKAAPFGAGVRHCIGHRLAETQCSVLLTEILKSFRLEPIRDVEVRFLATVSVKPSTVPVRLIAFPERSPALRREAVA